MIRTISKDDNIYAIIIPKNFEKDGPEFFTPSDFSQQLGYMKYPKGHIIDPHIHKLAIREVRYTQETIIVKSGRIRVDIYSQDKNYMLSEELSAGDVILLAAGGHGFKFLEESELIEIKQGPYISFEVDKERFKGQQEDQ